MKIYTFKSILKTILDGMELNKKDWISNNPKDEVDNNFFMGVMLGFELNKKFLNECIESFDRTFDTED